MAKILATLPDVAYTIVYQMIVAHLKADAVLSVVIPPAQWTTYLEDSPAARNVPNDNNGLPAVRMIPFGTVATPEANVLQATSLGIAVVVTTAGLDIRDVLNLWGAFERSLFPGDGSKTLNDSIRAALTAAGVSAGRNWGSMQTVSLGRPAIGASTDADKFMTAEGVILAPMMVPK